MVAGGGMDGEVVRRHPVRLVSEGVGDGSRSDGGSHRRQCRRAARGYLVGEEEDGY